MRVSSESMTIYRFFIIETKVIGRCDRIDHYSIPTYLCLLSISDDEFEKFHDCTLHGLRHREKGNENSTEQ
jgi:hypothetical protein